MFAVFPPSLVLAHILTLWEKLLMVWPFNSIPFSCSIFNFFLFVSALLVRALKALGNSMFSVTFFDHLLRFFSIHFSRTFQFTRNLKSVAGLFSWAVHAFVHHVQMNAADDDFLWNLNSCLRIKLCYRKIAVGLNRIHTSSPLASQCNCGSKMPIDMFLCIFERRRKNFSQTMQIQIMDWKTPAAPPAAAA